MWGVAPITLTVLALLIEAIVGYPDRLVHAIGHPVTWMGRIITALDRVLNRDGDSEAHRRAAGVVAVVILVVVAAVIGGGIESLLLRLPFGIVLAAIIAGTLLAQHSLHDHVSRVATALDQHGLAAGRDAVSHIVGRDPQSLDRGWRRARRDRKLGGEFFRRSRRPCILARRRRACGRRGLQSDQHCRQHDRTSHAAPCGVRLCGRAAR